MLHSATDEHSSISRSSPRSALRTLSPPDVKASNKSCECWSSWKCQPVQIPATPPTTPPSHQPCPSTCQARNPVTCALATKQTWQPPVPRPLPRSCAWRRNRCTHVHPCPDVPWLHAHTQRHFTPTHPCPSQIVLPRPRACRRAERRTNARCAAPGVA